MKWCQAVRIAEKVSTLRENDTVLPSEHIACFAISKYTHIYTITISLNNIHLCDIFTR